MRPSRGSTVNVNIRIEPRLRFLAELIVRRQRRNMNGLIEAAILSMANDEDMRLLDECWSTDEQERLVSLYQKAPNLCSFDEELEAKRLISSDTK